MSNPTGFRPASQQQRQRTIHNEAEGKADIRLGGRTSLGVLFGNLIDNVDVPEELDEFRYSVGTDLGYAFNVARNSRVFVAYKVTFELSPQWASTVGELGCSLPGACHWRWCAA